MTLQSLKAIIQAAEERAATTNTDVRIYRHRRNGKFTLDGALPDVNLYSTIAKPEPTLAVAAESSTPAFGISRLDQRRIVEEMCVSFERTLFTNVGRVPETWDGMELRQWFADKAAELYTVSALANNRKRLRAYQNDLLEHNL